MLRRLGAADRFDVLIKLHDHPKDAGIDWGTMLAPFLGPHVRLLGELDVIPLLAVADLLITDASPVSSEYSLVDRPMVFLDVPVLIAKAQSEPESAVDLETWGRRAGALVREPAEVVDAVADELANPHREGEVRRAMARDLLSALREAPAVATCNLFRIGAARLSWFMVHSTGLEAAGAERGGGEDWRAAA